MQNPKPAFTPLYLVVVGIILILGVLIWQSTVGNTTNGVVNPPANNSNLPNPNVLRVSLTDAKTAYEKQSAVFVDVRDTDSFKSSHITGAISIPLADLETRIKEINPNQWIITYCT